MQTFLPYPDAEKTAKVLDYRRLGKQRVEAMQLINAIENGGGWSNHPAAKMWAGYIDALKVYHNTIIHEWVDRGYNNNMKFYPVSHAPISPPWWGDEVFHRSHQSNLVRKFPEHYRKYFPDIPDNLPYVWPKNFL